MGSANNGWCNFVSLLPPGLSIFPTFDRHQIVQEVADCSRRFPSSLWPGKVFSKLLPQSNEDNSRPQLRHPEIRRVQELPSGLVTHLGQFGSYILPVILEDGLQDPSDIFNHHGAWPDFIYKANHRREQVALILPAELLPSDRKGRTWQATR